VVCDTIAKFVIVPSMKNEHMNVNKVWLYIKHLLTDLVEDQSFQGVHVYYNIFSFQCTLSVQGESAEPWILGISKVFSNALQARSQQEQ
jgi:hypothetical protein